MKVTEDAIEKLKEFVKPNSGLAEGIKISQGNACCGPSIGISKVRQPLQSDISELHQGINFYIDNSLQNVVNALELDFENNYFNLKGIESIENNASSGCC